MNESKNNNFIIGLSKRLETCHICGSMRNIVQLNDIPKREQRMFKEAFKVPEFKNASIVYCVKCAEYSIVSKNPIIF